MEIDELMKQAVDIKKKEKHLKPVVFIENGKKDLILIGLAAENIRGSLLLAGLRLSDEKFTISKIFMVNEAWMSKVNKKDTSERAKKLAEESMMPSQDPKSIDILMASEWNVAKNKKNFIYQQYARVGESFMFNAPVRIKNLKAIEAKFNTLAFLLKGYLQPEKTREELKNSRIQIAIIK